MKLNSNFIRIFLLLIILSTGIITGTLIFLNKTKTQFDSTLTPFFRFFGNFSKTADRTITKIVPVDGMDEKAFGEAIVSTYLGSQNTNSPEYIYLNNLISDLTKESNKPFKYRVFILDSYEVNAFALPGGVIFFTRPLLNLLDSESEVVSILTHETGHIELNHCFDLVRFELLSKKIDNETAGYIADFAYNLMVRHSFSKTTEDEADSYAYDIIINSTQYDPYGVSGAFKKLQKCYEDYMNKDDQKNADILRDYFMTHPPLELRIEKFEEEAKLWYKMHKTKKRYVGKQNLISRLPFSSNIYEYEWIKY